MNSIAVNALGLVPLIVHIPKKCGKIQSLLQ
jgi:hypothetical protein